MAKNNVRYAKILDNLSTKSALKVHKMLNEYESRHNKVMGRLRKGIRFHLKGNFLELDKYTEGDDSVIKNCDRCVLHQKGQEFYEMFEEELSRHNKQNILSELRFTDDKEILRDLSFSWLTYKQTIRFWAKFFKRLNLWIEDAKEDGKDVDDIETLGLKVFKKEVVSHKEITEKLAAVLEKRCEEHKKGSDVDRDAIIVLQEFLVGFNCYDFRLLSSGIHM